MKGKTAFNAMEGIDPRYILEAAPDAAAPVVVGRRTKFLRLVAVAAALAVVVAVGAVVAPMLMKEPENPTEDEIPDEKIYSVASTVYNGLSLISSVEADLILNPVEMQDENHPPKDTFVFKNAVYDLVYQKSFFHPEQDYSVHRFEVKNAQTTHPHPINSDSRPCVFFFDDGSMAGIQYMELGFIDMSECDTDEYVISAAQVIAEQYTDLGRYEHSYRIRHTDTSKGGFVIWYNEIGGKQLPGNTSIGITNKGVVWALSIGFDFHFSIQEEHLPTNERIIEIVKKNIVDNNLCNIDTVRDVNVEYTIVVFRGDVYAHVYVNLVYAVNQNDTEGMQTGHLEYLIPIPSASVSYGESETPK